MQKWGERILQVLMKVSVLVVMVTTFMAMKEPWVAPVHFILVGKLFVAPIIILLMGVILLHLGIMWRENLYQRKYRRQYILLSMVLYTVGSAPLLGPEFGEFSFGEKMALCGALLFFMPSNGYPRGKKMHRLMLQGGLLFTGLAFIGLYIEWYVFPIMQ